MITLNSALLTQNLYELHFTVKDTGISIPPDKIGRLFQSFSQLDASLTRQFAGTGLGLAISKRLAELMGGTMWAESDGIPGHGTTFHFTLVAESVAMSARPRLHGRQPALIGKRLLIVDDNPTTRRVLSLQTQTWGMRPVEVATPSEALVMIRRGDTFDLAILDMHVPEPEGSDAEGMDGVRLAEEICRMRGPADLPLIMLTSLGCDRDPKVETVTCFAAYLTKPVKSSQLYNTIVEALKIEGVEVEEVHAQLPAPEATVMAERIPLRILLAEDVAVNQKFALLALSELGYTADVVANGRETVTAIERQPYDVILMDVQMPIMDGLEATQRIRTLAIPQPYIIAMTANAMQGDREMCLEAGMDDYISKPVYLEELRTTLARAALSREEHQEVPPAPAPPLDLAVVEKLLARPSGLDLLALYVEESREIVRQLAEAVAQRDADAVREAAHSLKGSSRYVGASQVAVLSAELEQAARASTLDRGEVLLADLEHEFNRACQTIDAMQHSVIQNQQRHAARSRRAFS